MTDYADLSAFLALPRLTALALSPDGARLVAAVQRPDAKAARYVSSLWEVPLAGGEPVRLTRSEQGESAPAFLPDGSLVFTSGRPDPDAEEDETALWVLPPVGEPRVLARSAGGVSGPVVAADAGTVVVAGSRLPGSDAGTDADRRKTRKDRRINAILHTGLPVRYWDHELGPDSPRLLLTGADGELRDLTPDAGAALVNADHSITADGGTVATTWRTRGPGGTVGTQVVLIDTGSGERTVLGTDPALDHDSPRIAPDGSAVALLRTTVEGSYETPTEWDLLVVPVGGGPAVPADLGDLYPTEWVWSADAATLYVCGDWHGRGAVLALDPATGAVRRRLASDAAYSGLCPAGASLYAIRSAVEAAPHPVRLDVAAADQAPQPLPTPAPAPVPPGRLEEVETEVAGATVRGWLCRPEGTDPAPLLLFVHGGPFASFNSWSWRWNPWTAVARGWAVLLPDPALSTGYGQGWIERAWPHRAAPVWADLEGLLDAVVARPDIDGDRTACAGASFGGYLTNWIAGHTGRFGAIVTHSGTWALDQKNDTADVARHWLTWFGRPADHPDWYAENSPHHFADAITTPMLIVHGNRDYRVPVSEGLRAWFDLVSRWTGDPEALPHRFLNFPDENHWILSPANAEIWYDAVLGFCARHTLGAEWEPVDLL